MKQLKTMLDEILVEAKKKVTHIAKPTGKPKLPKPKPEKHNADYHQKEPVPFKKPAEPKLGKNGMPTADAEQKKILDKNEEQAEVSTESCEDLTEAQKFRKWQAGVNSALAEAKKRWDKKKKDTKESK